MAYTIKELAHLAGVSTRTLRYYDEIGLLPPAYINSSGYRIYEEKEVDTLQQILFFKELGLELSLVQKVIQEESFNPLNTLRSHLCQLEQRQRQLQVLIQNVKKTILKEEGILNMTDLEKFEGFKKELITENEKKYGKEMREHYGENTIDESNRKMMNLSQEAYRKMQDLAEEIKRRLEKAVNRELDFRGEEGAKIAHLHKEWLSFTWPKYSIEAHHGLAEMYLLDERFKAYYDKKIEGCAQFLRDAIVMHIK